MKEFSLNLKDKTEICEQIIRKYLPDTEGEQKTVLEAMHYSVEAGGKRLRPLLMMEFYELFPKDAAWDHFMRPVLEAFMTGMEMIHTFSLCHDDLPCMDGDQYRRGRESTWFHYGEDMGTLTGDALSLYAFEITSDAFQQAVQRMNREAGIETGNHTPKIACAGATQYAAAFTEALRLLAGKSGIYGMLGGQVVDVEMTGKGLTEEQLMFIYRLKTAALLEGSMMIGACLAGQGPEVLSMISSIGEQVGIAFQIQDDILDETSTTEILGKPIHSDEENHKTTYVSIHGLDASRAEVKRLSRNAEEKLKTLTQFHTDRETMEFLGELTDWLINREK